MPGSTVHLSLRFSKNWSEKRGGAALGTALPMCSSDHYVTPPPFCQEPTRIIACLINIEFHGQLLGFSHYQVPSPSPAPHSGQAGHFPVSPASRKPRHFCFGVFRPPATWLATQASRLHPSPQPSWLQSWGQRLTFQVAFLDCRVVVSRVPYKAFFASD